VRQRPSRSQRAHTRPGSAGAHQIIGIVAAGTVEAGLRRRDVLAKTAMASIAAAAASRNNVTRKPSMVRRLGRRIRNRPRPPCSNVREASGRARRANVLRPVTRGGVSQYKDAA